MPMSAWDSADENDREWALALEQTDAQKCPVCGGDDPEQWCQNHDYQHAWVVTTRTCYKQRAVLMAMERFKDQPYVSAMIPSVHLDLSRAKSAPHR